MSPARPVLARASDEALVADREAADRERGRRVSSRPRRDRDARRARVAGEDGRRRRRARVRRDRRVGNALGRPRPSPLEDAGRSSCAPAGRARRPGRRDAGERLDAGAIVCVAIHDCVYPCTPWETRRDDAASRRSPRRPRSRGARDLLRACALLRDRAAQPAVAAARAVGGGGHAALAAPDCSRRASIRSVASGFAADARARRRDRRRRRLGVLAYLMRSCRRRSRRRQRGRRRWGFDHRRRLDHADCSSSPISARPRS